MSWYADTDADGFGDPDVYLGEACDDPGDGAPNDLDCDDTDGSVYPGASETWYDGIDSDCNGLSDFDQDLDGFDSVDFGGDDCDDTDPFVHPGRTDICDDGIDNDCDGVTDPCAFDHTLWGEAAGDIAGSALASGDVNGDGFSDLLIGADREDRGGAGAGAAYVVYGPLSGDSNLSAAGAKLIGQEIGDHAGISIDSTDLDGDGFQDVLVGAYDSDLGGASAGTTYVVHGPVTGEVDLDNASAFLLGEQAGDLAGYAVAGGGDINGDGTQDLLIGAYENGDGGASAGAAYLVEGPVTGNLRLWSAGLKIVGEQGGDQAGWDVAFAGDQDGDGVEDLLIGAPYAHPGGVYAGAAYVVDGSQIGTVELDDVGARVLGANSGDLVGYAVANAGDVNNDGYDDLLIGGPEEDSGGNDAGAAWLFFGPVSTSVSVTAADATFQGENNDDYVGGSVAGAGDLNADGRADLVIGAHRDDTTGSDAGAAYLLLGPATGTIDLATVGSKALGVAGDDWAGQAVSTAGDIDNDGFDDVLIGVPFSDDWDTDAGQIWVVRGGGW